MKIAILGATGAVGQQMMLSLKEENIKVDELVLLASARSVGKEFVFNDKVIKVQEATENSFEGVDIVLGASDNQTAIRLAPHIKKAGAVFIDNSSAFRLNDDVPLIVPEINGEDAKKHNGIISNPNCSTIIAFMALYGVNKKSKITKVIASTYQAVSGAGVAGLSELEQQIKDMLDHKEIKHEVFPYQIAYNVISAIGSFYDDGYSTEEMKMQNEGRKILHNPDLKVTCTCVRVPVLRSHSISISFKTENELTIEEVREAIKNSPGVKLMDDSKNAIYPMPISTSETITVEVGRIRKDDVIEGYALFCSGDQIIKGAAGNAVQIIKCL